MINNGFTKRELRDRQACNVSICNQLLTKELNQKTESIQLILVFVHSMVLVFPTY